MEENRHVRKSNVFVEGRYRFGVIEQKILLAIISKIRIEDKEFVPYRISWSDLKEISRDNLTSTRKLDQSCEKLKGKTIKIREGEKQINFGFLSGWTVVPGAYAEFRIDPGMKEMLLDLLSEGRFTLYNLECVLSLGSTYSIRMYELLKAKQYRRKPFYVPLGDLKWILDIDEKSPSHAHFGMFRRLVLEKAKKDLQRHTDIKFTYKTVKERRKVVGIEFHVMTNGTYQKTVTALVDKRKFIRDGDTVVIGGKDFFVQDGCARDDEGLPIPIGQLNGMLKKGKLFIKL